MVMRTQIGKRDSLGPGLISEFMVLCLWRTSFQVKILRKNIFLFSVSLFNNGKTLILLIKVDFRDQ